MGAGRLQQAAAEQEEVVQEAAAREVMVAASKSACHGLELPRIVLVEANLYGQCQAVAVQWALRPLARVDWVASMLVLVAPARWWMVEVAAGETPRRHFCCQPPMCRCQVPGRLPH